MKKVAILSGCIGAGKTTSAKYLQKRYAFKHLSFVEKIFVPIINQRGLENNRKNLQLLGIELMETPGERSLVEELLSYLPVENWGVVDDVRYPSTIHLFQELCERVVTIYIVAPFDIRYPRLQTRDGIFSIEEQRKAEQASTEIQIEDIRSFANFLITNTSSTEDLQGDLDKIMQQVGINPL